MSQIARLLLARISVVADRPSGPLPGYHRGGNTPRDVGDRVAKTGGIIANHVGPQRRIKAAFLCHRYLRPRPTTDYVRLGTLYKTIAQSLFADFKSRNFCANISQFVGAAMGLHDKLLRVGHVAGCQSDG